MATRDEYLARTKGYNRPAINFNQRDDVRDFARSAHGQNYNRMMDIQRQLPGMDRKDPLVQEFKDRRRTFNRYGKYPMGEMFGTSPLDMQDKYMDLSRDVRQTNKPVYNKMYPLTGMAMDYPAKGGLLGMMAGDVLGKVKDFSSYLGEGITNALRGDSDKEKEDYVAKTFGFYPSDVHPGLPVEDDGFVAPPDDILQSDATADIIESDTFSNLPHHSKRSMFPRDNKRVIPGIPEPTTLQEGEEQYDDYIDRGLEEMQEPLPFDQGKEDFIREQNEYVSPPPVFPGNVRQDPQDTDAYLRWLTAPRLGSADPQGDFDSFNEYADNESGLEVTLPLPTQEPIPFDDSDREEGIMRAMRAPYAPRIKRSTFVAPHDEFDPDQFRFDDMKDYYEYLRKKRGLGEFTGDYYQGFR